MKIEQMIAANRADCSGCAACANVCPRNAIVMRRDVEGFAYPAIIRERCVACGKCDATCPALNFKKKFPDRFPKVFAAINPNKKIRRHSSSGGIFTALSEIVLRGGGIVFGAGFDKNFRVVHKAARTSDELENLRGSKYVQSEIGDVYRQVWNALKSCVVLFSGTPCQCAGLKNFLGGKPENLFLVDIVCHGTPSPALWEKYIGEFTHAHEVRHVNFRSKRRGWQVSHMEINFADQGHYLRPINQDVYGKIFLSSLSERPSCHACKFKFPSVQSDLTLGDAWGIQRFAPELFDNRGTSIVIVHTELGGEFLTHAGLIGREVKFLDATANNPCFVMPSIADPRREEFFAHVAKVPDTVAVMQNYSMQDDAELRRQVANYRQQILAQKFFELAAHYMK